MIAAVEHADRVETIVLVDPALPVSRRRRGRDWVIPAFLEADRSIARYVLRPRRFRKLIHRIGAPTLLIHGSEDRLVSVDSARWAASERPCWTYAEFEHVGHVPMLEAGDLFTSTVTAWLASTPQRRLNPYAPDRRNTV
ncbi:MAG TPA: alpha/beta hydrolase [Acidimicrobiia bacterium]|nr:alpha/beta hydrolase [Acidimicrobiia bacterium]